MANEALWVMLAGIIVYGLVYRFYIRWFDKRVIQSDPSRPTPAHTYMDGVEFFPSNKYVMLGWHWKSIAALGPVTGPAIAIIWGWLPGFLWILIGNSLIGWLHDYSSMMTSVRNEGASLGPLTYQLIGSRARRVLIAFLAFYTILIFAAFLGALLPTSVGNPPANIAFYVTGLIGVLSGYAIFKRRVNVLAVTLASLLGIVATVYLTQAVFPAEIKAAFKFLDADPLLREDFWLGLMFLFSFLGAVLPLWSFAMPINYLGFYIAYFGVLGIISGSFFWAPTFGQPAFTSAFAGLAMGAGQAAFAYTFPLWPLMFVTIACGACSGWHGLLSSSLTAKQVDNEDDAHFVGGGSMLLEGILGLTSVVAVSVFAAGKLPAGALPRYVAGGAQYLSNMFGQGIGIPANVATGFMGLMVLILGLTLTQLALRFARLAVSELTGIRAFKNIYVVAIVVSIITYLLTSGRVIPAGLWGFIWTLFGGANQLLAGVCLLVVTLWLYKSRRPTVYSGVPMAFMLATTIVALSYTAYATFDVALRPPPLATGARPWFFGVGSGLAGVIAVIMVALALVLLFDAWKAFGRMKAERLGAVGAPPTPSLAPASRAVSSPLVTSEDKG